MQIARMSSPRSRTSNSSATAGKPQYRQKCAVRITYSPNRTAGQWRAHGRYIERESAAGEVEAGERGFDGADRVDDVGAVLHAWQAAGDRRLFKMIVSPEFGERVDLVQHARLLISRMERDLGTRLVWVGVVHHNTEHPHVHIALRGVRDDGSDLRLARVYIQHGIREHAEDLATQQIGYRTQLDVDESYRRQVHQHAYTALDRLIAKSNTGPNADHWRRGYFQALVPYQRTATPYMRKRLLFLRSIGLADRAEGDLWRIRSDFGTVLRAMQRASDRQRAVAAHRAAISDDRLPISVVDWRTTNRLEGRVLGHGEEDSGRQYMILEGTDHKVHFLYHSREIEDARANGLLRPGSFVVFDVESSDPQRRMVVQDLGDADRLLSNRKHLADAAKRRIANGQIPVEEGWSGWIGRYDSALARAASSVQAQLERKTTTRGR